MCNPAPFPENKTHQLHWDYEIETDYLISARRLYLVIIKKIKKKKRTSRKVDFSQVDYWV